LYIDDEPNNLNGFKAAFRFDYTIFIASDIPAAYRHLETNPDIRVILCDQRMPDKTGVQFFEEVCQHYPDPVRMLITGYADIESVINAVNKGHIFRYIKKPWTDADIRTSIEEGNKYYITSTELATKNRELEFVNNELSKFTYSITHDMRGPLVSVLGALELAKTMDNITDLRELLDMMESAVIKLDEYIRNTHEYYKNKKSQLIYENVNFADLVEDLSALFKISGKMDNVRFDVVVKQNTPFVCDKVSINIILNNLLSNAFKYQRRSASEKFVSMDIEVKNNNVVIVIKDNGIGIANNHINNIFTLFFRATAEEYGSGFGLYNVKDALNKLNGTIEVSSVLNEGTIFTVTIPGKVNGE
jgi:signal transduction histidine kinase